MVNFLADQVFHFESSWLSAGIPRHHSRACAWIEDKKNRWFSTSLCIARLFFPHHLHHLNCMPKKYTSTLQNTSSTTSTAPSPLLQLCLHCDSVIFTAMNYDGMKEASVSPRTEQRRTVKVQKEQCKTFLQSQTLIFPYLLRKKKKIYVPVIFWEKWWSRETEEEIFTHMHTMYNQLFVAQTSIDSVCTALLAHLPAVTAE